MSSARPVQLGIIGAGRIARNAFVPALASTPMAELAAAASRDLGRATDLRPNRAYDRYEALLEDPQVEGVYIATHNGLHHSLTLRALEHGKHVLCEKPLACDPGQCREMIDCARARGLLLVEGFMYRYHPQIAAARSLLQEIGEVRVVEAAFSYYLSRDDDVRLNAAWGGGSLRDVGCYGVDFCRLIFGTMPQQVSARASFHPTHQVDMALHGVLDFGGGRFGVVSCGFDAGLRRRALVCGTGGTISLPCAFFRRLEAVQLILNECLEPQVRTIPAADVFRLEIEDFARAIRGGDAPQLGPEDGYLNACVIEALLASARRGGIPQRLEAPSS